jgi:dTDP-4-dehydrorhamnose reductase
MRLLITGASGLLGLNLSLSALASHTVIGVDRGRLVDPPFELIQRDLLVPGAFERALEESSANAVIHCAAMADVDQCEREPDHAWSLNAELPGRIAAVCAGAGVGLVHISTDAVFDGTKSGQYAEEDAPNPTSQYARTKAAAERAVLEAYPEAIVARVNFYGWSVTGRRSLAEFFVNNLNAGSQVRGFTDVVFCPMLVSDLGEVLLKALEARLQGLYHAVGPEGMSKFDFGRRIARRFGLDHELIRADSVDRAGLSAHRAHNLSLSVHKLSTALGEPLPSFSTGLDKFYTQYSQGYPQQIHGYQQDMGSADAAPARTDSPAGDRAS